MLAFKRGSNLLPLSSCARRRDAGEILVLPFSVYSQKRTAARLLWDTLKGLLQWKAPRRLTASSCQSVKPSERVVNVNA